MPLDLWQPSCFTFFTFFPLFSFTCIYIYVCIYTRLTSVYLWSSQMSFGAILISGKIWGFSNTFLWVQIPVSQLKLILSFWSQPAMCLMTVTTTFSCPICKLFFWCTLLCVSKLILYFQITHPKFPKYVFYFSFILFEMQMSSAD